MLLDEAALLELLLLACMQYVDLNPVRAALAETPEKSDYTSGQDRIRDLQSADEVSSREAQDNRIEHGERAGWLAPVC